MDKILTSIVELITYLKDTDTNSPLYYNATTNPRGARAIFYGDPNEIPSDDQPCVIVRPVRTSIVRSGTRMDRREQQVEIVIVENLRNYSRTTPDEPRKVQSLEAVMEWMESADSTQKISGSTIVGKLLANPRLPYTDSGTKYAAIQTVLNSIDYVFNTSRGFPTFEVIGLFTVTTQGDRA